MDESKSQPSSSSAHIQNTGEVTDQPINTQNTLRNRITDIDTEAEVNSATVELSGMSMDTNENDWEELDIYSHYHTSAFDRIMGVIEDIVMSPEFQTLHNSQLESCYRHFSGDAVSPTPTVIFDIFKDYSQVVAHYIEHEIKKVLPDFDMEGFVSELQSRHDVDGDIYELVSSLIDCKKFQEMIDDYKNMKEGRQLDLSSSITVTQIQS